MIILDKQIMYEPNKGYISSKLLPLYNQVLLQI